MKLSLSFLSLLIIISLIGCGSDKDYRTEVSRLGQRAVDYNAMVSDLMADYLVVTDGDIKNHRLCYGVIYKRDYTKPKFRWRLLKGRYKGEAYRVLNSDKYLFVAVYEHTTKEFNPLLAKNYLYLISKEDEQIFKSFDLDSFQIQNIHMTNDSSWYMLGNYTNYAYQTCIVSTINLGETFDTTYIDRVIDQSKFDDSTLYFVNAKVKGDTGSFYKFSLTDHNLDSIIFDFSPYDFSYDKNNHLWMLGTKGDSVQLKKQEGDRYNTVYTFCVDTVSLPKNLYLSDDLMIAYISQIDYEAFYGQGSTRNLFYYSDDEGVSWRTIDELEDTRFVRVLSVYENRRISAFVGFQRVLTVYLDN